MKTVQMTLDDELVSRVDRVVKKLKTTRSAFARAALQAAIDRFNTLALERKQQQGYEKHPVSGNEFSVWADEQEWGDQ